MNALLSLQAEQQFLTQVNHSDFESFCYSHIDFFNKNLIANFSYIDFVNRTQRAKKPLQQYNDLTTYIALYGLAHYQRISALFNTLKEQLQFKPLQPIKVHIIDYGCGQGIATLAFIDYLIALNHHIEKLEITLIEPSTLALKRAIYWISKKAEANNINIQITTYACEFDDLEVDFLAKSQHDFPYVHLFNNILDMHSTIYFDLQILSQKIKKVIGQHYIFAISPYFFSASEGFYMLHQYLLPQQVYLARCGQVQISEFSLKHKKMQNRLVPIIAYAAKL